MLKITLLSFLICLTIQTKAQETTSKNIADTIHSKMLDSVIVNAQFKAATGIYLQDINGMNVYAGKKTNNLLLADNATGLALNLGRTALAKIPGLTMWEMDGAGTQLNIGSRGTDPHRSIEMNMRQNGYNTNSDMFGYPENHYTVPMQAIEEIQMVRGSAALQFGSQFGGMMNYKIKRGDSTKPFAIESEQTIGSNNFYNSYNAVGGTKGKLDYYAFYDTRHGKGWRNNSTFNYHAYYIHLGYRINKKMTITAEFSRMDYVQQIAGGLTDQQFTTNPKQSQRERNYFQPFINIPAIIFNYQIARSTKLEITSQAIFGERNSVQFINAGNIADTFNTNLGSYNPRQVDRDYYKGFTMEARLLHQSNIGKTKNTLSAGLRYFTELTNRKQKGTGTTGNNFDLTLTKPYGIDLQLRTNNYAIFAENIFQINSRFSVTPGVRYEIIKTSLKGVINNATENVAYKGKRSFPLFGAGIQYQLNKYVQLYGNISQAYRPYLYANITPADRLDKIDPSLKDSKGYDIDLGYRGNYKNILQFDINAFYLFYGNKIGLISEANAGGGTALFTTNIGNAVTKGMEAYISLSVLKLFNQKITSSDISIFNSLAYNDAKYVSGMINQSGINKNIEGNYIENAPAWVNKTGLKFTLKNLSFDFLYSYTSKTYNDAFNSKTSSNGVIGEIPAYHVWDFNAHWKFAKQFYISAGINNFTNEKYFNRRITMYPGPGILPADGRTYYISMGIKI